MPNPTAESEKRMQREVESQDIRWSQHGRGYGRARSEESRDRPARQEHARQEGRSISHRRGSNDEPSRRRYRHGTGEQRDQSNVSELWALA